MTDSPDNALPPTAQVNFLGQFARDISFEAPGVAPPGDGQLMPPHFEFETRARKIGEDVYETELLMRGECKLNDKPVYLVELNYVGVFGVKDATPEQLQAVLLLQAPSLLFPQARTIIANVIREGNFPPFYLNPPDFYTAYQRHMQDLRSQGQASTQAVGTA